MSDVNPKKNEEKEEVDPALDITSTHFDPLKALYAENTYIRYKNARVYDNLSQFESAMKGKNNNNKKPTSSDQPSSSAQVSKTQTNPFKASTSTEPIVRRFLPHQQMVKGQKRERHSRNILQKLERGYGGPTDKLKSFMEDRKRVKIYTRKEHGILGYLTGFIEMFDKHWNIVLSDVCEVWKRKKTYLCDVADFGELEDCSRKLRKLKLQFPIVTARSLNRKYVECTRKVPQLMVRGEQVVVVMLDTTTR
ncbi:U7 snRNA-associated Sm-like protein LSm11 [Pseudolycoriella hygida]|uniref:U7 snRNA-associated Sm-like protein LSm11 n=1 Tax=Pseudolycoriella hygida TaxID=35572 RepID=A0A9Q0N1P0_9DIPT|nr:U7 snRNA-associated Sm-like protein LSm11 [Pseudolycoriella hygida]